MNQEAVNKSATQTDDEPNENQNNNFDALDEDDGVEILEDNLD